ncbi:MAG: trypsin-like peptidase domain-containing protein [Lachnospiraceae bacterium]|nr:trypsin-like peptidase domain-containing protein [Lachnospiraceae bacterium]
MLDNRENKDYYELEDNSECNRDENRKNKARKENRRMWKRTAVIAASAMLFGTVAGASYQLSSAAVQDSYVSTVQASETSADAEEFIQTSGRLNDVSDIAAKVMPSVVAITNKSTQEIKDMFYGVTRTYEAESSGSGIIISKNDTELLIGTNNHVVEDATTLSVCFSVETEDPEDAVVSAVVKGTDSQYDLAVIAVNLEDIPDEVMDQIAIAELGTSEDLKVGEPAIAVGNALGYGQSVTLGIISALNREVTVQDGNHTITNTMIQTDAAINFGNSGGALVNSKGQVIGINSVKTASSGVEGMGYAIPIDTAKPIFESLMTLTTRTIVDAGEQGYMGIQIVDVSTEAKQLYNMPSGAFISSVIEGSAAEKAGLVRGDIITKMDGVTISSRDELLSRMQYYKAGETIDVVVQSAQGSEYIERTVTITLGEKPVDETKSRQTEEQTEEQTQSDDGYYEGTEGNGTRDLFRNFFGFGF